MVANVVTSTRVQIAQAFWNQVGNKEARGIRCNGILVVDVRLFLTVSGQILQKCGYIFSRKVPGLGTQGGYASCQARGTMDSENRRVLSML